MQFRKPIVLVMVCAAAMAVGAIRRDASAVRHHASLSADVQAFRATHSTKAVRVIAHGGDADVSAAAARHGVTVLRRLDHAAVLEATAAQIDALSTDAAIEHLSGDLPVGDFMTVSTQATLADKTRAGQSGGLLGLDCNFAVSGSV